MRVVLALGMAAIGWAGECFEPSGPRITAGDLVRALPEFAAAPASSPVAYAPLAGIRRTLGAPEIERAARSLGVRLERAAEACFEWPVAALDEPRVTAALREAAGDAASFEVVELMRGPVPKGRLTLTPPRGATDTLWRGGIDYGGVSPFRVWVRARVRSRVRRVVAATELRARQPIRREDLRVEERLELPARGTASIEDVVGRVPPLAIAAGAIVDPKQLRTPPDVQRGEVVTLRAAEPGSTVSTEATAEASGRRGEIITVRNVSSGRRLRARIEGAGLVTVAAHPPLPGGSR